MTTTIATPAVADHYARACQRVTRLVDSITPAAWSAPSPCSGWTVRDLVNHLAAENLWVAPLLAGDTVESVGDAFAGDVLGAAPAEAWRQAARAAASAITTAGRLTQTVHLSFGDTPAEEYLRQLFADHLVHAWDLAEALGIEERLPHDLVQVCTDWFDTVEAPYRDAGVIGPRVAVPIGADDQAVLLARFGRSTTGSVVERFGAAVNSRDLDAIMPLVAADVVFEGTGAPDGHRHEGHEAFRAQLDALFAGSPVVRFDTEEVVVAGDRAVVRWRYEFADGHVRGIDLITVRDGKVVEKLAYVKG